MRESVVLTGNASESVSLVGGLIWELGRTHPMLRCPVRSSMGPEEGCWNFGKFLFYLLIDY